jgi:hypothetical protein
MEPTFSSCAEPFATPAAFFRSTDAGGVFSTNVKDLSCDVEGREGNG